MKKIVQFISSIALILGFVALPVAFATPTLAITPQEQLCEGSGGNWTGSACRNPNGGTTTLPAFIRNIVNILLFVIGAVAVVMIIIGGFKYVVSNGDQSAVTGAKNTILYAVIGLVIAILGYAVVEFVVTNLN